MIAYSRLLVVLVFCLLGLSAVAAPLAVGEPVPAFSAPDQFGKEFNSTNRVRFLLVATEMACAKAANQKLAAMGSGFLEKNAAAYVLDIHTMPGIARFFAFPKLRKYPFRIVLVDSTNTLARFPAQPGRVTVLSVNPSGIIQGISFWDPAGELATGLFH